MGLGKPKTLPCHESRFFVHCTSTLKSQPAAVPGFISPWIFSRVSWKAAHHPITPATMSQIESATGRWARGLWVRNPPTCSDYPSAPPRDDRDKCATFPFGVRYWFRHLRRPRRRGVDTDFGR